MPFVKASPNQFLLTGRNGTLQNRGSAVNTFLAPGTVHVLVPSTKQEARFEFTQETKDGIPLRFKGIVIFRITDPIAAAAHFDFTTPAGAEQIGAMLVDVCLGELRHAVSHMTMTECIEQRKTTLSKVVAAALDETIASAADGWGVTIEVAQLAQVFIVDAQLRQQLEAERRNEIRLQSEQSEIRTAEEARLALMASEQRVADQQLAASREELRRKEELFALQMANERATVDAEAPVRLHRIRSDAEVLRQELEMREVRNAVRASEVEHDLLQERAEQELRRQMLPLEQAPMIAESAAKVFQGANLSVYGEGAELLAGLAPLVELLARTVRDSLAAHPTSREAAGSAAGD